MSISRNHRPAAARPGPLRAIGILLPGTKQQPRHGSSGRHHRFPTNCCPHRETRSEATILRRQSLHIIAKYRQTGLAFQMQLSVVTVRPASQTERHVTQSKHRPPPWRCGSFPNRRPSWGSLVLGPAAVRDSTLPGLSAPEEFSFGVTEPARTKGFKMRRRARSRRCCPLSV